MDADSDRPHDPAAGLGTRLFLVIVSSVVVGVVVALVATLVL